MLKRYNMQWALKKILPKKLTI